MSKAALKNWGGDDIFSTLTCVNNKKCIIP